jgi:hypothetical protein
MGMIKEPEGIDFIIQSPPLTENEKKEISEFIQARKLQNKSMVKQKTRKKTVTPHVQKTPNA